ncbi:MAG: mitochondrial fission ELM1 family protein [Pseudomonadota bacterium]
MVLPSHLWIMTDGRAGNVAQARGLGQALARLSDLEIQEKTVTLQRWAQVVPPGLAHQLSGMIPGWPKSAIAPGSDWLGPPWPRAVIGAGRRVAPLVATLRQQRGVSAIQILDPQMPARAFDALIVPEHDGLTGANVLQTVGAMNRLTPQAIASAWQDWPSADHHLTQPRLAVLVGGPSGSARFSADDGQKLLRALEVLAEDFSLIITTSRRTDTALASQISRRLGGRALVWTGEADGPNPYPAMLHQAAAVLVTEDSVNMASEAASTGTPVHVFTIEHIAPKFRRFHDTLADRGASRRFRGVIEHWTYQPLAEADRIAEEVLRRGLI